VREILDQIPAGDAAHGFRKGRSALSYASAHLHQAVVVHLDLEDFFGSIGAGRVYGIFRQCGYPEGVAHLLTGLVTNAIPHRVERDAPVESGDHDAVGARRRQLLHLARPHLPQGAPTSPGLANLAAFGLDRRLSALATRARLSYTRYADDLAFSSPRPVGDRRVAALVDLVTAIARDEGFLINTGKTAVRGAGQRQRLGGIVVNERPNIDRREYDLLKAILHNAKRYGAASQNRDGRLDFRAHLLGRVAWVNQLNPERGQRLLAAFGAIDWSS
jgi:RNA-directed DNA polymerase